MKDYVSDAIKMLDSIQDKNMQYAIEEYKKELNKWSMVPIKLLKIFEEMYYSFETLNSSKMLEKIKSYMETILKSESYDEYESMMQQVYEDIKQDSVKAYAFGILNEAEKKNILNWVIKENKELEEIRKEPIPKLQYLIMDFSYHNHYITGGKVHKTGLTNDVLINKILDKLYEDDMDCAQIIRSSLEDNGKYNRHVATIYSEGSRINLGMLFDNSYGSGIICLKKEGKENNEIMCYNVQDGIDALDSTDEKDEIVERCMIEMFNIMKIVETF